VISAEGIRGLMAAYAYSHDPSLGSFIDVLFNAMWAKPSTCPAGSTVCVPDGYIWISSIQEELIYPELLLERYRRSGSGRCGVSVRYLPGRPPGSAGNSERHHGVSAAGFLAST